MSGKEFSVKEIEFISLQISFQMIETIEYLHNRNIIHCDIKTDNWVMTATSNGKLQLKL